MLEPIIDKVVVKTEDRKTVNVNMGTSNVVARIECLSKDNYDTWKMQMEALLVKNDAWHFVNGTNICPTLAADNSNAADVTNWTKLDSKAKSDIILSMSPSELKVIKGCKTSHDVWKKLQETYQSSGPARKATLLKHLTLHRMSEGDDIREHLRKMFDIVDKLDEMDVEINKDLLAIMILYSLPSSYENFRVAIESRDSLPDPESLRIKIIEESQARSSSSRGNNACSERRDDALFTNRQFQRNFQKRDFNSSDSMNSNKNSNNNYTSLRCFKCKKPGHKANECLKIRSLKNQQSAKHVAFTVNSSEVKNKWCLDSGASSHLCRNFEEFVNIKSGNCGKLNLATNKSADIIGKGSVTLNAGVKNQIVLNNTLHVPELRTNLLSVSKITDNGYNVLFKKFSADILNSKGEVLLNAYRENDLYFVNDVGLYTKSADHVSSATFNNNTVSVNLCSVEEWHRKLGHLNLRDMSEACKRGYLKGVNINSTIPLNCEICARAKMTRIPFPRKSQRKTEILDIMHSDLCGPMQTQSIGGAKYLLTFTDDASKWTEVRFLRSKTEVLEQIKELVLLMENLKGLKVKFFQSDNGTEFRNVEFDKFLRQHGISRRLSAPYTPQQNGVAERKNRTLIEMARCLLFQADLPKMFWAEAVNMANFIRNRSPSQSIGGKSPYEIWHKKIYDLSQIHEFGSKVVILDKKQKGKFAPRGLNGIFLGYDTFTKGYRIWIPDLKKIEISRDVRFLGAQNQILKHDQNKSEKPVTVDFIPLKEDLEPRNLENHDSIIIDNDEVIIGNQDVVVDNENKVIANQDDHSEGNESDKQSKLGNDLAENPQERRVPGRPKLIRTGKAGRPKKRYTTKTFSVENESVSLAEISMKEAMSSDDKESWMEAIVDEVKSIIKNDTWTMINRNDSFESIGSRIVLRNKYKPDGTIERRKARLVAQGFSQQPGVHFNETFAPVARMSSIRLLMSIAARLKMKIHQFDVATAYLNGNLSENIYMEPPKQLAEALRRIANSNDPNLVAKAKTMLQDLNNNKICKLNKSLYGLKQAGRNWNQKLDQTLKNFGAIPCVSDSCVYRLGQGEDKTLIITYVDDLIIMSTKENNILKFKNKIMQEFETNYLGEISYCLGVEFSIKNSEIRMNQKRYVLDLLKRFNMTEARPVGTPMDPGVKLMKPTGNDGESEFLAPYRELVGALTYLAVTTRPDISFAVSNIAQFNNCYTKTHWLAAKRILRYLKGTAELGLTFKESGDQIMGYVDSDWGGNLNDRRSQTGFNYIWNGGCISWDSRKQKTVALSTNEAEYMALTDAAKEAIHLQSFLNELGLPDLSNITLHVDNMGALKLAENPVFHGRSKHIDIRYHFIREVIKNKIISLRHVSTHDMVADILTKPLPGPSHRRCIEGLKLFDLVDDNSRGGVRTRE